MCVFLGVLDYCNSGWGKFAVLDFFFRNSGNPETHFFGFESHSL